MPERIEALGEMAFADVRFQFEIIKGLAESVREQTKAMMRIQEQQTDIVARLERIEAKETAEQVAALIERVGKLETIQHRREGAAGMVDTIMKSPALGWLVGAAITAWAVLTGRVNI